MLSTSSSREDGGVQDLLLIRNELYTHTHIARSFHAVTTSHEANVRATAAWSVATVRLSRKFDSTDRSAALPYLGSR